MRAVYVLSILFWWFSFLFGKVQAQTVRPFSAQHTNGDIELSPSGELWGIVNHATEAPDYESGFERMDMSAQVSEYITFPNRNLKHIAVSPQYVFVTEPDSNRIFVYSHMGQELNVIETIDNPGNIFTDTDNNAYVVETDLKKISRLSPQGQKTVIVADPMLTNAVTLTGDEDGNLFTADKFTGQIYRWEKATQQLYAFARIPSGSLCADGSQISEMVYMHGKLYVASVGLSVIYVVNEDGEMSLLAGSPGMQGEVNDVGNKARFMHPVGLAASVSGDTLFVSDNGKIRMITQMSTAGIKENIAAEKLTVYPNPSTNFVNIKLNTALQGELHWKLINMEGKEIENGRAFPAGSELALRFLAHTPCGGYYVIISNPANPLITHPIYLCND